MSEKVKTDANVDERQVAALFELSAAAVDESAVTRLAEHAAAVATRQSEPTHRFARQPWLALAAGLLAVVAVGLWLQAGERGRTVQVAVAPPVAAEAQPKPAATAPDKVVEDVLVSTEALADLAVDFDPLASSSDDPLVIFEGWDDEDEEWNTTSQGGEDEVSQ
jgi:hypothetical protein